MIFGCCSPVHIDVSHIISNEMIESGFDETKSWLTPPLDISAGVILVVDLRIAFPAASAKMWFAAAHTGWFYTDFYLKGLTAGGQHLFPALPYPIDEPRALMREIPWAQADYPRDQSVFPTSSFYDYLGSDGLLENALFTDGIITNVRQKEYTPPGWTEYSAPANRLVLVTGAIGIGVWMHCFRRNELILGYFNGTEYLMTPPHRWRFTRSPCDEALLNRQFLFRSRVNTFPGAPLINNEPAEPPETRSAFLIHIYTTPNP